MLKAPKTLREELDIRDTDNIKLVTYCKDEQKFQDVVMKEYLNYQLYNEATDFSYNTTLTTVKYVDSEGEFPTIEKVGFMLEPTDVMAKRLGCRLLDDDSPVKTIYKEHYKNFVVFQYMTGNTDWNLSGRHNIRLLKCDEDKGPIPVPYDFDYSGLVNAEYAKPHPMLPIENVTERLFQRRGSAEEDFSETYNVIKEKKGTYESITKNSPHLTDDVKNEAWSYIEEFYTNIDSPEIMKVEVMKARQKK